MSKIDSKDVHLIRELRNKQKVEAEKAAHHLLAQSGRKPEQEAKRIEAYDAIINQLDTRPLLDKRIAVVVAVVCIVIVGILYSLPRNRTQVLLELEADSISINLVDKFVWPISIPISPPLNIKGLNSLDSLLFSQSLKNKNGNVWLNISEGEMSLSELTVEKEGTVDIETDQGRRYVFYLTGSLSGSILANEKANFQFGDKPDTTMQTIEKQLSGPESFDFTAAQHGAVPTTITFRANQPITLHSILVNELSFVRELANGQFISTIVSGTIRLPEVNEEVDLRSGEWLKFKTISGRVTHLEVGERIKIKFQGIAKGIQLGPKEFEHTLDPNWLTYIHNEEKLIFIWSSFIFLWGILWSIRKIVFT